MDSNLRMSTVRATPNPKARTKREEEDNFLLLPMQHIVDCLNDLGMEMTIGDIQSPKPAKIQRVYEFFVEIAMNITRDVVAPAMKAAAEDIGGQYSELYPADTLDLLGLFANLRKLFNTCRIYDFALRDLFAPTSDRVIKHSSYVINFLRFRESQQSTTISYFDLAERTKSRIQTLYTTNATSQETLSSLERNRKANASIIREKEAKNEELKRRLLELEKIQRQVMERLEKSRKEQTSRKKTIEDNVKKMLQARQEAEKLRPYATQSREALETALDELRGNLARDKTQIDTLERRERALQTSLDAFTTVSADVDGCVNVLHDLSHDLSAEEKTLQEAERNRSTLLSKSNSIRDIDRLEKELSKQLDRARRNTDSLLTKAEERKAEARRKMAELKTKNEELSKETAVGNREMERKRARIEQTEKKMADLRENIESEVGGARREFGKLEAHVRLYVEEMGQSIGC